MSTHMKEANELLFGSTGLGATNVKLFPGNNRFVTAEQIAAEFAKGLKEVLEGKSQDTDD